MRVKELVRGRGLGRRHGRRGRRSDAAHAALAARGARAAPQRRRAARLSRCGGSCRALGLSPPTSRKELLPDESLSDGFDLIDPASLRRERPAPRGLDGAAPTLPGAPLRAARLPALLGDHAPRGPLRDLEAARPVPERAGHLPPAPRPRSSPASEGIGAMRTIIEMDPPRHRSFRKVAAPWFTPRALNRIDAAVRRQRARARRPARRRDRRGRVRLRPRRRHGAPAAHPLDASSACRGRRSRASCGSPTSSSPRDDEELQRPGDDRQQAITRARARALPALRRHRRGPPQEPARRSRDGAGPRPGGRRSRWARSRPSATT